MAAGSHFGIELVTSAPMPHCILNCGSRTRRLFLDVEMQRCFFPFFFFVSFFGILLWRVHNRLQNSPGIIDRDISSKRHVDRALVLYTYLYPVITNSTSSVNNRHRALEVLYIHSIRCFRKCNLNIV